MGPIVCIVGARPNFMKIAPILRSLSSLLPSVPALLVHTGQHYDHEMSDKLFRDLNLPIPDVNLEVGSGTHALQTAEVMKRFEPIVDECNPSCVLVVGDVNSTLACSLVAVKKNIPVAHVEAGLRSFDKSMPEEINRILTDQIATRLYTTEEDAKNNLLKEGISPHNICFVGNVMIDSLVWSRPYISNSTAILSQYSFDTKLLRSRSGYGLVTLHRPSNVDKEDVLHHLLKILIRISGLIPLMFTLHPRTQANLVKFNLVSLINSGNITLLPPQGYLEMLGLMSDAKVILTDSGGIQEETTALGIPCLTLRSNTERPVTVEAGTNTVVGHDEKKILSEVESIISGNGKRGKMPKFWDGKAADRIVLDLKSWLI